jgi:hypothetical protein
MRTYEVHKTSLGEDIIKRTDEDGSIWWIPTDPTNADYQAYLNRDNPDWGKITL